MWLRVIYLMCVCVKPYRCITHLSPIPVVHFVLYFLHSSTFYLTSPYSCCLAQANLNHTWNVNQLKNRTGFICVRHARYFDSPRTLNAKTRPFSSAVKSQKRLNVGVRVRIVKIDISGKIYNVEHLSRLKWKNYIAEKNKQQFYSHFD